MSITGMVSFLTSASSAPRPSRRGEAHPRRRAHDPNRLPPAERLRRHRRLLQPRETIQDDEDVRPVPPGGPEIPAQQRPPPQTEEHASDQQDAALKVRDKKRGTPETGRHHQRDVRGVRRLVRRQAGAENRRMSKTQGGLERAIY